MNHEFTMKLDFKPENVEEFGEMSERLYVAGCNDGLVYTTGGVMFIDFDREADSRKDAIAKLDIGKLKVESSVYEKVMIQPQHTAWSS